MALTINTNIASLRAQRQMSGASSALSSVAERLASGQRINRAGDDPAGLAVADNLKVNARIYTQAIRNANDGISMLSIADGAVDELSSITTRLAELSESAANGTYSNSQRKALNLEARALVQEYNRIIGSTSYNGQLLFAADQQTSLMLGLDQASLLQVSTKDGLTRNVGSDTWGTDTYLPNSGTAYRGAESADLNHDGAADIVVCDSGVNGLVFISNGDGTFRAPVNVMGATDNVRIADFNGDGNSDLVASYSWGAIGVYLGRGDGTFQGIMSYSHSKSGSFVTANVADLNGDGFNDFVTVLGDPAGSTADIFLGNGDGTFRKVISTGLVLSSWSGNGLTVFDANEDGKADLLHEDSSAYVRLSLGNGDGTFKAGQLISLGPGSGLVSGDLNSDGHIDYAAGASVYLGNGDGTFLRAGSLTGGVAASTVDDRFVDMNGDGINDVLLTSSAWTRAFLGNGDGTFTAGTSHTVSGAVESVGDLNGDGALDLIEDFGGTGVYTSLQGTRKATTMPYIDLSTAASAREALGTVRTALTRTALAKGYLGAYESRVQAAVQCLEGLAVTHTEAESRIRDADIAEEAAHFARLSILRQATAAVLTQANQQPAMALKLLKDL